MVDLYSILCENWWKTVVNRVAAGEKPELVLATFGFLRANSKERAKLKEMEPHACAGCGKIFLLSRVKNLGFRKDKTWCSNACRQKTYRSRLANGEKLLSVRNKTKGTGQHS